MRQIPLHAVGLTALLDVSYPPCIVSNYRLCELFDECVTAAEHLGNAESIGDDDQIERTRRQAEKARDRLIAQLWAVGSFSTQDLDRIVYDLLTVQQLARLDADRWNETQRREARRSHR